MADREPPALQPPLVVPATPPATPMQLPAPPAQQNQPAQSPLNWYHFKPEFSGKPEDDAEAHLLRTNYQMETHNFSEAVKVQRFCLSLIGEARLWYESLRPIALDGQGLQDQFRQQYSQSGNMREQLFHAWRSFHYDENTETLDTYVTRNRQVAVLLGYGQPQILEVFKNTLPNRLYWVLFPTDDLRLAVETVKKILTKEKIDRQPSGQSGTTIPFMKESGNHNSTNKRQYHLTIKIGQMRKVITLPQ